MVIKSNMLATFTSRQLNINEHLKATVTEKLSSGYKVNRAADDAAGLSQRKCVDKSEDYIVLLIMHKMEFLF